MSNRRKARAGETLTRFVKTGHEKPKQLWLPNTRFDAVIKGRSIFHERGVKRPDEVGNVLVSGHNNIKIGRDVRKGKWRGYWIYTLTLEERATCPTTCKHWQDCYGNNMPWAKRISDVPLDDLTAAIERDIQRLTSIRGRNGVLVRLHALGDFPSAKYVWFWDMMLARYPTLAVFGYTAHPRDTLIGQSVDAVKTIHGDRFRIRWSDGGEASDCTVSIEREEDCPPDAFVCPEQTGKTLACATCGACWSGDKNVAFIAH